MADEVNPDFHEFAWDPDVDRICVKWGFGRVMESAARQWSGRDPQGALTVGPPKRSNERDRWLSENAEKILEVLTFADLGINTVRLANGGAMETEGRERARIEAIREIAGRFRVLSGNT